MKNTLVMFALTAVALSLGACHTLRSFNECMEPETTTTSTVKTTTTTTSGQ